MKEHLFNRRHVIARVFWETVITAVPLSPGSLPSDGPEFETSGMRAQLPTLSDRASRL